MDERVMEIKVGRELNCSPRYMFPKARGTVRTSGRTRAVVSVEGVEGAEGVAATCAKSPSSAKTGLYEEGILVREKGKG
jgi:hypothetical protein